MAWEDRPYYRDRPSGGFFGSRLQGASMVMWLLGINAAVFILDAILRNATRGSAIAPSYWGSFNIPQAIFGFQVWRFFTYQFLHAGFFHIFFNMLVLFFFGPLMEQWWGSRRFLAYYLLCGASGAVLYSIFAFVPGLLPATGYLVGASGAVFGVLVGCAVAFPHQRVMLLIPPIPMSMRTLALIVLGIAALTIIVGGQNAGGEAAHLGGAGLGFVLMKFPSLLGWSAGGFGANRPSLMDRVQRFQRDRERKRDVATEQEVDRILDKVRDQGLQSLSRREKKILQEATDRQRRAG